MHKAEVLRLMCRTRTECYETQLIVLENFVEIDWKANYGLGHISSENAYNISMGFKTHTRERNG
jgi:hypothetical protein